MFLSASAIAIEYGIDDGIAKFFVDREPPNGNLYWKDKLLYLRPQPGYVFIPLIADLYFRSGIPKGTLLGEEYVGTVEGILHFAAEEEAGLITETELNAKCREFVRPLAKQAAHVDQLSGYLDGERNAISELAPPYRALQRGDVFLYSLCALDLDEQKFRELISTWFALISILLLMDDSEDYKADLASGDSNVFVESGSNRQGFDRLKKMLSEYLSHIQSINYSMAHALHRKVAGIADKPGIREYLNN